MVKWEWLDRTKIRALCFSTISTLQNLFGRHQRSHYFAGVCLVQALNPSLECKSWGQSRGQWAHPCAIKWNPAFNFTLAILRQKTHPVSLGSKSEAECPLLPCGFVAAVFLDTAVSSIQLNRTRPPRPFWGIISAVAQFSLDLPTLEGHTNRNRSQLLSYPFAAGIFSALTFSSFSTKCSAFNFPFHLFPAERLIRWFYWGSANGSDFNNTEVALQRTIQCQTGWHYHASIGLMDWNHLTPNMEKKKKAEATVFL